MMTEADNGTLLPTAEQAHPAASAAAASFAALLGKLEYLGAADIEHIRQAYRFADEAHLGQLRKNGDPYITHPIAVAAQCAEGVGAMTELVEQTTEFLKVRRQFGSPLGKPRLVIEKDDPGNRRLDHRDQPLGVFALHLRHQPRRVGIPEGIGRPVIAADRRAPSHLVITLIVAVLVLGDDPGMAGNRALQAAGHGGEHINRGLTVGVGLRKGAGR